MLTVGSRGKSFPDSGELLFSEKFKDPCTPILPARSQRHIRRLRIQRRIVFSLDRRDRPRLQYLGNVRSSLSANILHRLSEYETKLSSATGA